MTTENPGSSDEEIIAENKALFNRIRAVLPDGNYRFSYESKEGSPRVIIVNHTFEIPDLILPPELAKGFSLPLIEFSDSSKNEFEPVSTPYGRFSSFVLNPAEGEIHTFGNTYFFDSTGKAGKYEEVVPFAEYVDPVSPDKKFMKIFGQSLTEAKTNGLMEIDFTPQESDSRLVGLESGDYEKIYELVTEIENGELNPTNAKTA